MRAQQDDPVTIRSPLLFWAFGWYLRWMFWRSFSAIRIARAGLPALPAGRPLIIYTNHPSWWDPALFILLASTVLRGRAGFGPMEAASFRRYGLFRRMGVFGIDLDSKRGAARFLALGLRILHTPSHVLWITAEGRFTDVRQRPVRLRAGIAHLARRAPDAVIVPLAMEYTFWNERRPDALLRFGAPIDASMSEAGVPGAGPRRSVAAWTALLEDRLTETMDALAADAARRDASLFRPLLRGRVGVGGIYDLWRRISALAARRPIELAHEPQRKPET